MADEEKAKGNAEFSAGNYMKAIEHFTSAIKLGATHVLFSNRSACYCGLKEYQKALDDVLVAFLILSRILDETHVLNITVAPAWQRRGIARRMLQQALASARADAMSVVYLEVRESNQSAQALYRQLGFEVCGVRKNYYRRGEGHENAVLMQCLLSGGHK